MSDSIRVGNLNYPAEYVDMDGYMKVSAPKVLVCPSLHSVIVGALYRFNAYMAHESGYTNDYTAIRLLSELKRDVPEANRKDLKIYVIGCSVTRDFTESEIYDDWGTERADMMELRRMTISRINTFGLSDNIREVYWGEGILDQEEDDELILVPSRELAVVRRAVRRCQGDKTLGFKFLDS